MHDEQPLNPELADLALSLRQLRPSNTLGSDQLMFAAGMRAAERRTRRTNRVLAASCVSLASLLVLQTWQSLLTPASPHAKIPIAATNPTTDTDREHPSPALPHTTNDHWATPPTGPTNRQLMHQWVQRGDFDFRLTGHYQATAEPPSSNVSSKKTPRDLLRQYLAAPGDPL